MSTTQCIDTLELAYPPDCIEFVPGRSDQCIIGTYFLDESESKDSDTQSPKRNGNIVLCQIQDDTIIEKAKTVTDGGAYDLHFAPGLNLQHILGVATSTGLLSIYEVHDDIVFQQHVRLAEEDVLITSFAWHPHKPRVIAAAQSSGAVVIYNLGHVHKQNQSAQIKEPVDAVQIFRHSEAAWHTHWTHAGLRLFHGGDDMVLGWIDQPNDSCETTVDSISQPLGAYQNRRIHGAGVTAVLSLSDDWILTGSYDDHLRVVRVADGRATEAAALKFEDGVFRLRLLGHIASDQPGQSYSAIILASCMRAGSRIIKVECASSLDSSANWTIAVLASFTENTSLNYASAHSGVNFVSLSFYEKKAFLWRWQNNSELVIQRKSPA